MSGTIPLKQHKRQHVAVLDGEVHVIEPVATDPHVYRILADCAGYRGSRRRSLTNERPRQETAPANAGAVRPQARAHGGVHVYSTAAEAEWQR